LKIQAVRSAKKATYLAEAINEKKAGEAAYYK